VFVATNVNLPYWQEAQAGLTDAQTDGRERRTLAGPDKFDPPRRTESVPESCESKPAGIMISVGAAGAVQDAIDTAIAQGIP